MALPKSSFAALAELNLSIAEDHANSRTVIGHELAEVYLQKAQVNATLAVAEYLRELVESSHRHEVNNSYNMDALHRILDK